VGGKLDALQAAFRARGGVVVGFSGGVDSALLAKVAHDALGDRALSVVVDSPTLARAELEGALAFARALGLRCEVAEAREMDNPLYVANPGNRCYFCRGEMSSVLRRVAAREGLGTVAMGVHVGDLGEERPGHAAMREAGVWWPLVEVGAAKEDVRAMARQLGLSVAEKPSMACLSSRIAHGEPITLAKLRRVELAEAWLAARGFRQVRVRAHGDSARVEVPPADLAALRAVAAPAEEALRALGFRAVAIDPRGYRPGAPDEVPARGP
jgi:uncharacterized protein